MDRSIEILEAVDDSSGVAMADSLYVLGALLHNADDHEETIPGYRPGAVGPTPE